jgi:hypothetical protein
MYLFVLQIRRRKKPNQYLFLSQEKNKTTRYQLNETFNTVVDGSVGMMKNIPPFYSNISISTLVMVDFFAFCGLLLFHLSKD